MDPSSIFVMDEIVLGNTPIIIDGSVVFSGFSVKLINPDVIATSSRVLIVFIFMTIMCWESILNLSGLLLLN